MGSNSFTDKASLTLINSTLYDNPTQAVGRPLVGVDAIAAASIVSEEEDLTIYGNVGTAVIDVNGKSSVYDLVQAINSRQGETGICKCKYPSKYFFPDQFKTLMMLSHSSFR